MRRSDGLHILYENIPQVEKQAVGRRIEALMKNTDIRPSDIAQLMHISVQAVADVVASNQKFNDNYIEGTTISSRCIDMSCPLSFRCLSIVSRLSIIICIDRIAHI